MVEETLPGCQIAWCWFTFPLSMICGTFVESRVVRQDIMKSFLIFCSYPQVYFTIRLPLVVEQKLLTLPEYQTSPPSFRGLRVALSFIVCLVYMFGESFVVLLYFVIWPLNCPLFNLRPLIAALQPQTFLTLNWFPLFSYYWWWSTATWSNYHGNRDHLFIRPARFVMDTPSALSCRVGKLTACLCWQPRWPGVDFSVYLVGLGLITKILWKKCL
jgi:hypothetical protein